MNDQISSQCILKTAPEHLYGETNHKVEDFGLITVQIETPYYVWCEILTHKRLSRNASSNRAMGTQTNLNLGYFIPDYFCAKQKGMSSGDVLDDDIQNMAHEIWIKTWEYCKDSMIRLDNLGVAKEQSSRVLPTFKIMKGLITATQDGWNKMLDLRISPMADKAMMELALKIRQSIKEKEWNYSYEHLPFLLDDEKKLENKSFLAAGRIARLSYGDIKNKEGDIDLGRRLLVDKHFSCFEHSANWVEEPVLSNLCSKSEDKHVDEYGYVYGWQNIRSEFEETLDNRVD